MPFIQGRYHINPAAGEALEAARAAEEALRALKSPARDDTDSAGRLGEDDDFGEDTQPAASTASQGPIHRVEIEAAELVPSQTGRASRGFVARVHRSVIVAPHTAGEGPASSLFSSRGAAPPRFGSAPSGFAGTSSVAVRPETHVFANHADLLNFLHDQLTRETQAK